MVLDGFKPSDKPLQMIAVMIGGAITILKNMSYESMGRMTSHIIYIYYGK